jgi:hypothetical protein
MNLSTRPPKVTWPAIAGLLLLLTLPLVACTGDECIPGFKDGQTYEMTFTGQTYDLYGVPSCQAMADVDNLMVGSVVDVAVSQSPQTEFLGPGEGCRAPLGQVTSDVGLALGPRGPLDPGPQVDRGSIMFLVDATATVQGCDLYWALEGQVDGPIANPAGMWASRYIMPVGGSANSSACATAFPNLFAAFGNRCEDTWDVTLTTK